MSMPVSPIEECYAGLKTGANRAGSSKGSDCVANRSRVGRCSASIREEEKQKQARVKAEEEAEVQAEGKERQKQKCKGRGNSSVSKSRSSPMRFVMA
jgi:hypothetical protein